MPDGGGCSAAALSIDQIDALGSIAPEAIENHGGDLAPLVHRLLDAVSGLLGWAPPLIAATHAQAGSSRRSTINRPPSA